MAGIFGAVGDVSQDELEEMSHRLRHRGPIARTVRMSDRVYLGCIGCNEVDSFFTDGRFVVVGDIHIYNRDELKATCESLGLVWRQELWYTRMHKVLRAGGICVEIVKR